MERLSCLGRWLLCDNQLAGLVLGLSFLGDFNETLVLTIGSEPQHFIEISKVKLINWMHGIYVMTISRDPRSTMVLLFAFC